MFEKIGPVALLGQLDHRLIAQQFHDAAPKLQLNLTRQRSRLQWLHLRAAIGKLTILCNDSGTLQTLKQDVVPAVR